MIKYHSIHSRNSYFSDVLFSGWNTMFTKKLFSSEKFILRTDEYRLEKISYLLFTI